MNQRTWVEKSMRRESTHDGYTQHLIIAQARSNVAKEMSDEKGAVQVRVHDSQGQTMGNRLDFPLVLQPLCFMFLFHSFSFEYGRPGPQEPSSRVKLK